MRSSIGAGLRIFAMAAALTVAGCGAHGTNKMDTSSPGANAGDNTRVSTIPDAPAADTGALTPANYTITISQSIYDDYQVYLGRVGRIGNGYYAVTEDGKGGASWSCSDALCGGSYNGKDAAKKQCQTSNPGKTCLIFAKDNHPQVKFQIAQ